MPRPPRATFCRLGARRPSANRSFSKDTHHRPVPASYSGGVRGSNTGHARLR